MKKSLMFLLLLLSFSSFGQKKLFHVYKDSASLVTDANDIVNDFVERVNAIKPVFTTKPVAILNTQPYLISFSPKTNLVNLPIWHQVMSQQQEFFYKLSGSEKKGEEAFGLLFNGFYLPHELGHALQTAADKREPNTYLNEFFANQVAVLYWKKVKRKKELKQCYKFAKKMVAQLESPVPEGEDPIQYFQDNYRNLAVDPYKYGYFQFEQFVKIYEDEKLADFDEFIEAFLSE